MSQHISIEWDFGRPQSGANEDEHRAQRAAEAALDAAGVDYLAAMAAHDQAEDDPTKEELGLYKAWKAASEAANVALTEGWSNPEGAYCTIRAYAI